MIAPVRGIHPHSLELATLVAETNIIHRRVHALGKGRGPLTLQATVFDECVYRCAYS